MCYCQVLSCICFFSTLMHWGVSHLKSSLPSNKTGGADVITSLSLADQETDLEAAVLKSDVEFILPFTQHLEVFEFS